MLVLDARYCIERPCIGFGAGLTAQEASYGASARSLTSLNFRFFKPKPTFTPDLRVREAFRFADLFSCERGCCPSGVT